MQENIFGEFALVQLTFGLCTYPTNTFPFTYHPFNVPSMCAVDNFQRLKYGNSRSPDKFTGEAKNIPTSSQESVNQKSTFTFTFTLRLIYKVNRHLDISENFPHSLSYTHTLSNSLCLLQGLKSIDPTNHRYIDQYINRLINPLVNPSIDQSINP